MMFNVLICEDNEGVSKVTKRILTAAGYEVTETNNGSTALEILYQPKKVDLLLTDLILPLPISGFQLVTRAKALNPKLPIVVMTGYSADEINPPARFRDLAVLKKPISRSKLLQSVFKALEGTDLNSETVPQPKGRAN